MLERIYAIGAVLGLALGGLAASYVLHGRMGVGPHSRRIASAIGGFACLAAVILLDVHTAIVILSTLTLLIIALRLGFRRWLRGVRGRRSSQSWSEITYVLAATSSVAIGWGLLGNRWLGFLPVAFMAWGDNAAGILRDVREEVPWPWPSAAMLAVCLAAAAIMQPYWLGAAGAVVATAAERYRPPVRFWDDNLNLVSASLTAMAALAEVVL